MRMAAVYFFYLAVAASPLISLLSREIGRPRNQEAAEAGKAGERREHAIYSTDARNRDLSESAMADPNDRSLRQIAPLELTAAVYEFTAQSYAR
jgi:hypothetical protein